MGVFKIERIKDGEVVDTKEHNNVFTTWLQKIAQSLLTSGGVSTVVPQMLVVSGDDSPVSGTDLVRDPPTDILGVCRAGPNGEPAQAQVEGVYVQEESTIDVLPDGTHILKMVFEFGLQQAVGTIRRLQIYGNRVDNAVGTFSLASNSSDRRTLGSGRFLKYPVLTWVKTGVPIGLTAMGPGSTNTPETTRRVYCNRAIQGNVGIETNTAGDVWILKNAVHKGLYTQHIPVMIDKIPAEVVDVNAKYAVHPASRLVAVTLSSLHVYDWDTGEVTQTLALSTPFSTVNCAKYVEGFELVVVGIVNGVGGIYSVDELTGEVILLQAVALGASLTDTKMWVIGVIHKEGVWMIATAPRTYYNSSSTIIVKLFAIHNDTGRFVGGIGYGSVSSSSSDTEAELNSAIAERVGYAASAGRGLTLGLSGAPGIVFHGTSNTSGPSGTSIVAWYTTYNGKLGAVNNRGVVYEWDVIPVGAGMPMAEVVIPDFVKPDTETLRVTYTLTTRVELQ